MATGRPFQWEYEGEPVGPELFRVEGGRPLHGTVRISGAKNASLKLFAAAVLTGERCRFTNVPEIEDVRVMADTLRDLGVEVDHQGPNVYEIASGDVEWQFVPLEAAAKMRASFILLGPLLARCGSETLASTLFTDQLRARRGARSSATVATRRPTATVTKAWYLRMG